MPSTTYRTCAYQPVPKGGEASDGVAVLDVRRPAAPKLISIIREAVWAGRGGVLGIHEGIHVLGLPPVAYVFAPGDPNGWTEARLGIGGAHLELRCLDVAHRHHGQLLELEWR